jgi:hypothetical protein
VLRRVHLLPTGEPEAAYHLGPKGIFIAYPWVEPKPIPVLVIPPENELAFAPERTISGPLTMTRSKEPNASRVVLVAVSDFDTEPPAGEVYGEPVHQPNAFAIAAQTAMYVRTIASTAPPMKAATIAITMSAALIPRQA